MAYDRSDAREQRRNELAARLAEARERAGRRKGGDWRGVIAPLSATALLLVLTPDAVLSAMGRSPPILSTVTTAGTGLVAAIERSPAFNDPPTAEGAPDQSTAGPVQMTLSGHDPEGAPLTVTIVRPPAHGELVVPNDDAAPLLVEYRPATGFSGYDGFAFVVDDGALQSPVAERVVRVYAPPPQVDPAREREATRAALEDPDEFDPTDPSSWRDDDVTPEYIQRAQQILDAQLRMGRTGQLAGDGRRDARDDLPSLMPALVPTAELEGGAR